MMRDDVANEFYEEFFYYFYLSCQRTNMMINYIVVWYIT